MASISSLFQLQVLTEATLAQGKRLADGSRLLVGHRGVFGVSPFKYIYVLWRFPKIEVPPVMIHFRLGFSSINQLFGYPIVAMETSIETSLVQSRMPKVRFDKQHAKASDADDDATCFPRCGMYL